MNLTIKRENDKKHIMMAIIVFLLCSIMISIQPLRASAEEVSAPITDIGTAVASLYSSGVATYIAAASVGIGAGAVVLGGVPIATAIGICVAVFLVGMGVSLTVSLIAQALNKAYEFGYFQSFIDRVCEAFRNGSLSIKSKLVVAASLFTFMYNWVKTHVVGYFNERKSNVNLDNAVNGYELLSPAFAFDHVPTTSEIMTNVAKSDFQYGDVAFTRAQYDAMSSGQTITINYNDVELTNNETGLKYSLGGLVDVKRTTYYVNKMVRNTIQLSDAITVSFFFDAGNSWDTKPKPDVPWHYTAFVPYVYVDNGHNKLHFCDVGNHGGNDSLLCPISMGSVTQEYYFNSDRIVSQNGYIVFNADNNKYIQLKFADNTTKSDFVDVREFLFYLCTRACNVYIKNKTDGAVVGESANANITYSTVNNYYNSKSDALSRADDVIGAKVGEGEISAASSGTVSIGATSVAGAITNTSVLTNSAAVTDVTNTDIVTEGNVVVPANSVLTVAAALIVAGNNVRAGLATINGKFPFDVIPNVRAWLNNLVREGQPLVIDYDIDNPLLPSFNVHMDFSRYAYVSIVSRWVLRVSCAIGLLLASRKAFDFI